MARRSKVLNCGVILFVLSPPILMTAWLVWLYFTIDDGFGRAFVAGLLLVFAVIFLTAAAGVAATRLLSSRPDDETSRREACE